MSLESIFVESKKIKVGNAEVAIKQVALGDLPRIAQIISKFLDKKNKTTKEKILEIITQDFDSVIDLLKTLTDIPQEKIPNLNIAAIVSILSAIVEENAIFLLREVAPQLAELNKKITGLSKSKG